MWAEKLELIIPGMKKPFLLETDASNVGLGAVLRQENNPVAYISRTLSKTERNYGISEKEMLAVIWACEKFQFYLQGTTFTLVTDHKPIEEIRRKAEFGTAKMRR